MSSPPKHRSFRLTLPESRSEPLRKSRYRISTGTWAIVLSLYYGVMGFVFWQSIQHHSLYFAVIGLSLAFGIVLTVRQRKSEKSDAQPVENR